jgi:prephenate dehydratase
MKRGHQSTNPATENKKSRGTETAKYYGSEGAFSHVAAEKYFSIARKDIELLPSSSISNLFDSVSTGEVNYCIVPYENSVSGTISSTIVQLLLHPKLHIVGEILDADELCLCGATGATLKDVKTVLSHSHLLAQAGGFLSSLEAEAGSTIKREPTFDSASACTMVGTDVSKAAIASRRAAETNGLTVLKSNFADVESETRYVILALNSTPPTSSHRLGRRCTVSYVLANRAGAMFKSLSCFAFRDLSIIKVSTVPLGGKQKSILGVSSSSSSSSSGSATANRWDYVFVVDFVASSNDKVNQAALESLKEFANSVRILGEYSAAEMRNESPSKNMHHLAAF